MEAQVEYKRLEFKDNKRGQKKLEQELNKLGADGWRVVDSETKRGKFGIAKTAALGAVFLPLALAGRKKGKITVMLER
jgi:hypothetical protein